MGEDCGPWRLLELIAVGGVGEVWRAVGPGGATAAVKRLHSHLARNDEARAMFAVEQRLATTLPRHDHLLRGLDAGAHLERPYVAFEIVPGADLRRTLDPAVGPGGGPGAAPVRLPLERALAVVAAACDAASHLHAHGWVHGDINPGNLVGEFGADGGPVVLCDLGVARALGSAGPVRGTHAYMAPEQVRGEAWTPATDVFALGVVLHELVSGARLFHRGPPWLSMAAVMEHEPPALRDPGLDAIARAALDKDPARRTATAAALAQRVRDHRAGS